MPRKPKVLKHQSKVKQSDERNARNMIRIELACMLRNASAGYHDFGQDILARASSEQKDAIKKEMRELARMLDHKIACEDEA